LKLRTVHTILRSSMLSGIFLLIAGQDTLCAQGNITFDLKKPKAYESRKLPSELTPEGKINPVKRIKENVVSHYNFYFNAHLKIDAVLRSAKQSHIDSFNNLIPFYNFSLDQTASQQQDLDSVIIKTNNGILLHDLRSDWVDDLYFLMGKGYFYQKKFDSAYDVFQYINYTFQPREKEERGLEKSIGSNLNNKGNIYTISSPENKGISAAITHRPIRNDALLWIAKSLMEQDNDDDARGMIETLYRDQLFPNRLKPQLAELKAYGFYRKKVYDSTAFYLEGSMDALDNNAERARRWFLMGQLYALANKKDKADRAYEKAVALTTDPVMEAYARINQVSLADNNEDRDKKVDSNVKKLLQMADREKYLAYQSIIYSAAAEMEQSRNNVQGAIALLVKSNEANSNDPALRNRNHLSIAELAFSIKQFELAKIHYDSINMDNLPSPEAILEKKTIVGELAAYHSTVQREDSLQRIAAMPEKEREIYLNDLLKKLKKESGIPSKEDDSKGFSGTKNMLSDQSTVSIFPAEQKKGEWYFYNPALKAQGSIAFKNKWGTRPNTDNWRRSSAVSVMLNNKMLNNASESRNTSADMTETDLTIEGLMEALPLTEDLLSASNAKKFGAYRKLGMLYKDKLDECKESVGWHEKLISQQPQDPELEKILFDLAYCYAKVSNQSKTQFYTDQLQKLFPASAYNLMLKDPMAALKLSEQQHTEATQRYQRIYDLFLAGKFKEALQEKQSADATFGQHHWTPQLLFIESIYYVQTRQDSLAVATLNKIPEMHPGSPMAMKAGQLADVVTRREEIENELKGKEVVRTKEDTLTWIDDSPVAKSRERVVKTDTLKKQTIEPVVISKTKTDSTVFKAPVMQQKSDGYTFDPTGKHLVILLLNNVDLVFVNEAKRAIARYHAERFAPTGLTLKSEFIGNIPTILIESFPNLAEAIAYTDKTIPIASKEIFPWLPAEKFRFLVISPENLTRVMEEKNTAAYLQFIQLQLPGKF